MKILSNFVIVSNLTAFLAFANAATNEQQTTAASVEQQHGHADVEQRDKRLLAEV